MANPSFATEHSGYPDQLDRVRETAAVFGLRLMPWQESAIALATQYDGDQYLHQIVVISVPRQSGKSTWTKAIAFDRLVHGGLQPGWEGALLAQTRKDASRFILDWGAMEFPGSKLYRGIGNEQLSIGRNLLQPYSPKPDAMHGRTLNTVMWDEIWSFDAERGREMMQAAFPAMATKRDRQTIMVSTAGSTESKFFREWVERGRSGEIALVEYSAPAEADLDDLRSWEDWHPAYGITQDSAGIKAARSMFEGDDAGFRRAFANQWPEVAATIGAIHPERWAALQIEAPPLPDRGSMAFAIDVDPFGASASIAASWRSQEGRMVVELVDHREGTYWLLQRLKGLLKEHGARQVWAQDFGPVAATLDLLDRERIPVERIPSKAAAAATQAMLSAIGDGTLAHTGQDALTRSAIAIGTRGYGDGVQWLRRDAGITSPLTSACWAHWAGVRVKRRGALRIVVAS